MIRVLNHTESQRWLGCMLCALTLVRTPMWNLISNKRLRLSRRTVARYNARIVRCSISKELFLQQLSSLQKKPLYRKKLENMTFNFEKFFFALRRLHRSRNSHRNGMIFCMNGICAWITLVPSQWNFVLVKKVHDSILKFRFLHCKFTCRTLGEESTCVATTSNISFP